MLKPDKDSIYHDSNDSLVYHVVACGCGHDRDHMVTFRYDRDDGDNPHGKRYDTLTIAAGMNHFRPWYKRLGIAILYVLGIDNTYCQYTELYVTKQEEVTRLRTYIDSVDKAFNK